MMRRAQSGVVVAGVEPRLHAYFIVRGGDQAGEILSRLFFQIGRKAVAAPSLAQCRCGAGDVAACEQRPRQREMPLGGVRRLGPEEVDDGLRLDLLLPQHRFRVAPHGRHSRPARIGGEKGSVARKIARAVFAVQDHPFDDLAGDRIGNAAFDVGRLALLAFAHEVDGLLHGRQIQRRRRSCRRGGEGRDLPLRWRQDRTLRHHGVEPRRSRSLGRLARPCRDQRRRNGQWRSVTRALRLWRRRALFFSLDRRPMPRQGNWPPQRRRLCLRRQHGKTGHQQNGSESRHGPSRWVGRHLTRDSLRPGPVEELLTFAGRRDILQFCGESGAESRADAGEWPRRGGGNAVVKGLSSPAPTRYLCAGGVVAVGAMVVGCRP